MDVGAATPGRILAALSEKIDGQLSIRVLVHRRHRPECMPCSASRHWDVWYEDGYEHLGA